MAFDPSPSLLNAKLNSSDFGNSTLRLGVDAPNPNSISLGDQGSDASGEYKSSQNLQEQVNSKGYNSNIKTVQELVNKFTQSTNSFDVMQDYDWTLSRNKTILRREIPFITMREFKIATSNALNSLFSTLASVPAMIEENQRNFNSAANAVGAAVKTVDGLTGGNLNKLVDTSIAQQGLGKVNELMGSEAVTKSIQQFKSISAKVSENLMGKGTDSDIENDDLRKLYAGLYTRKATGVTYTFPHFTKDWVNISNNFGDTYSAMTGIEDLMTEVTKMMTTTTALVEPGVYVQRPKFYEFAASNQYPVADVTFTLYNTVTPDAYVKNKSLIQRLIMQNLPHRHSRVVIEPPCIYEVRIPGKAFYPFCYIDSLIVTHNGTKRIIAGEVVPDAYVVKFSIRSLTSEANNFYDVEMRSHGLNFDRTVDRNFTGMVDQFKSVVDAATNKINTTPADVALKQEAAKQSSTSPSRSRSNDGGVINTAPPQGNNGPVDDSRVVVPQPPIPRGNRRVGVVGVLG